MSSKGWIMAAVLSVSACAWAEAPYQVAWTREIGPGIADAVAVDASGNVYVSGSTRGDLDGANAGENDVFLSKFDSGGNELWITQIGTSRDDVSYSVAVDTAGNVYITGYTRGDFGGPNADSRLAFWRGDAFLIKFDSSGNEIWRTQIGTRTADWSRSVAVDASGNAYITGHTRGDLGGPNAGSWDAFLSKFDALGNHIWTRQISTRSWDWSHSVAVDAAGNVYITGWTEGGLVGPSVGRRAFLMKFDSSGNEIWRKQFSRSISWGRSIAVDAAGNVYVGGMTFGSLNPGREDAFLCKFNSMGKQIWLRQIGTSGFDRCTSVAVDTSGNVYMGGWTEGDLGGTNTGGVDMFVIKFDSSGNEVWTTQIDTFMPHMRINVALDAADDIYISGVIGTKLPTPSFLLKAAGNRALIKEVKRHYVGGFDSGDAVAFLIKLEPAAETTTLSLPVPGGLVALCLLALCGLAVLCLLARARRAWLRRVTRYPS